MELFRQDKLNALWPVTSTYIVGFMSPNIEVPVEILILEKWVNALLHLGTWLLQADERQAVEEVVPPIDIKKTI